MIEETHYEVYSPTSVIGIFNNALKLPATITLIYLKGRYAFGGGKAYVNYYYDHLYSEGDNTSIGVKMPGLLRSKITNNEIYTLRGFIEKKIKNSSIELIFVVDNIISQEEKTISEEDLKRYDLIQKKLEKGSIDLETFVREKVLKSEKIKIANIYGHSAIVQRDFSEGLCVSQNQFVITDFTCNITSATSIIDKLKEINALDFDMLALVRGGGDKQSFDAFNDTALAECFIQLNPITITAIGHTIDETLIDKLADKRFHLPHDYGAGLHSIIDKLSQEKSNSRAMLIDEVKRNVTKQFEEQVKTLAEQLGNKNKEFLKLQDDSAKQISLLNENTKKQLKNQSEEMTKHKTEVAVLHEKNLQSSIHSATAALTAKIELATEEKKRLQEQLSKKRSNLLVYIILLIVGIIIGFIINNI
ncbi:exodeoxyribonuclease VII large subunit [Kaistella carnis]|uniref:exodeoxyribonuclease VII large subunit n=1 Tax=Kaistella carnis TaxID=1241979 RepID=UPI00289C5C60|nr:exodeoxyribonuclease VII large subunit [Kaistella carnis]